jgi:hypothetical protein
MLNLNLHHLERAANEPQLGVLQWQLPEFFLESKIEKADGEFPGYSSRP